MIDVTHQLKAAPLYRENKTASQSLTKRARSFTRLNRKGKRKQEALERRFRPATRPLNKRERREQLLDQYEDSLYAPRHQQSKPRKPQKPATADAAEGTAVVKFSGNGKQRRKARRDASRAAAAAATKATE